MTSTANQQHSIPATNTSTTAASYASAAGAPKKPATQQSVAVSGSQPAVVVSSSASPAQNAQSVSPASVNGKPAVAPAVPAVARGTSNGAHSRHSSVTMSSNGPNSFTTNGGSVNSAKSGIQFGFVESPAVAHSTPQTGTSAPIPIPGGAAAGNPRVQSPAHSPSPIPQPSASGGGRPPSGLQPASTQMTFGSLSSDGERHMRQGSIPQNHNAPAHFRRESNHSIQSDQAGRGNFVPQGGRGRGFNPHGNNYNNQLGYPPNNQFRNNGQGRGMPPSFQPQPRNMQYPNSPQPHHRSPAPVHSLPGTPNMPPANMQPNMSMQTPPQHHYVPPMAPQFPQQNFGFPPQQVDQYGRPYSYNMPYMPPPQNSSPNFNQGYVQPYPQHKHAHSMSRTPSQPERPPSVNQQGPAIAMGSNSKQQPATQPPHAQSISFQRPKKSGAIPIKTASGEVLDTTTFKVPASPAPSSQHARTPPVVASTPTPPPSSSTLTHARTDSAAPKTAKQIQDELKEKIKQATQGASKEKPKEDKPAEAKPTVPAAEVPAPAPVAPAPAAAEPATAEPAVAEPAPTAEAAKEETAVKTEEPKAKEPEKPSQPPKREEPDEDEMERIIREMEEEDARREKQQEEYRLKKEAEKAASKVHDEASRKAKAAEEDRKLREQEREMERLEEEKEKRRQEADQSGKAFSVADALAGREPPKDESPKVDAVADKLAGLKLGGDKQPDAKLTTAEKRGVKPAALNLAPLNTGSVEPAQPSAALQSLKSARFLKVIGQDLYPEGIKSPNPALNPAVASKGKTFKYDASFLLQFQKVFTEQPSVEFHQQVKTLIGDNDGGRSASGRAQTPGSARQGSRGAGASFNMGTFNAPPGGRTLPTGTTSADRFAMSSGAIARPQVNPMNSFQRPGGAFPMSTSMSRTSSQSNMGPNSPRQSSRRQGGSRRDGANSAQAAKTMPLTAGQEVKPIAVTAGGWKPMSIVKPASGPGADSGHMDPDKVQRKVKAALNKMTPENFDRISDQILVITSQSKDETDGRTLRQVIQLTFEKATDEAHWASMYAKFCKKMLETMSSDIKDERIKDKNGNVVSGGPLFRKYLLNRCQEEFERGWTGSSETPESEEKAAEKKPGEAVMLSDEYYAAAAAKRRGLGLVQFIGELYKLGMLTERIMLECVHKLVDHKGIPDEAEIESLSKLLRTIGANLDQSEKGRPMMDVYFGRIGQMMDAPELPSRMKYMLMDVVDLRRSNWQSKEANKGPKTLEEVRAEAEAAQAAKAQESARSNQRGGGGGRPQHGRGDGRNFSAGYTQQASNQVGMDDLRRLKGSASRTTSGSVTLGPTSMFSSRSNSGRRLGPGGSLGRPGEDSGNSSRTGTPPVRESASHSNAFSLLANMETENPASPPSTAASPAMSKAVPASDKKDGE